MAIAPLQKQIHQLQAQLKFSQSPKQTKLLQGAIARLEEKLNAEVAEQAKLKAEAEAKAKEAEAQKEQKTNAKQASSQVESQKKKRGPLPPKKKQRVKHGNVLEAVPGQGHHAFSWKTWAEIQTGDDENYRLHLEDNADPILISRLSKQARTTLENLELPAQRFCTFFPVVKGGKIESVKLQYCSNREKQPELFLAKGYWIAEDSTLQIQTDFRFHGMRSRNMFHQIPVKEGITPPETGFRSLLLERDRISVYVTGEVEANGGMVG